MKAIALAVNKRTSWNGDRSEFDAVVKDLAGYVEALPTPVPVISFPIVRARRQRPYAVGSVTVVCRARIAGMARILRRLRSQRGGLDSMCKRVIRPQGSDFRS